MRKGGHLYVKKSVLRRGGLVLCWVLNINMNQWGTPFITKYTTLLLFDINDIDHYQRYMVSDEYNLFF